MKSTAKLKLVFALALLISTLFLVQACGDSTGVPDGASLTVSPNGVTVSNYPDDSTHNFTVVARYVDGTPIPNAMIHISGSQAVPYTTPTYQFYSQPDGTANPTNVAVDSGFIGQTDKFGVYNFSIVIYGATKFDDVILFNLGTATKSVTVSSLTTT